MKYVVVGIALAVALLLLVTLQPADGDGPGSSPPVPPASPVPGNDPVVDPIRDAYFWCHQTNPSCRRGDPWWMVFAETPLAGRCRYAFLPQTLVTDCALVEAVVNTALWPVGRTLLEEAAAGGVTLRVVPQASLPANAIAVYRSDGRQILIGDRYHRLSTWMVSAIVVHELWHARQHRQGQLDGSCVDVETPAYQAGADYVRWLAARMGGMPPVEAVQQQLSDDDERIFDQLQQQMAMPDLRQWVRGICDRPFVIW
ncbi:MAG: hypothetical protein AB7R89_03500 [Dehalococcoidia bacterium]